MSAPSLLIFWDYDTQWGADRSRAGEGPRNWGALEFECTDRVLELHGRYGVRACFAVVGAAALPGSRPYHDPDQVRRIAAAGHELASHSHHHDWLPGLSPAELRDSLRNSREAIERCAGVKVTSFIPPYNQPFDYLAGGAISLSERLHARPHRNSLADVCRALGETGYQFCRIHYVPLLSMVMQRLKQKRPRRARRETIQGIQCLSLSTCGFADDALRCIEDARPGEYVVVYGHPHSIHSGNTQDERYLVPFLEKVASMRDRGCIRVMRPSDLIATSAAA